MTNGKSHMRFRLKLRTMIMTYYKLEFSKNFARFHRLGSQQRQNEWR